MTAEEESTLLDLLDRMVEVALDGSSTKDAEAAVSEVVRFVNRTIAAHLHERSGGPDSDGRWT